MTYIITLLTSFFGIFAIFKYLLLIDIRIDNSLFSILWENSLSEKRKIIISEGISLEKKEPTPYDIFCFFKNVPLYRLSHAERLLQSGVGHSGTDSTTVITTLRWNRSKILDYLENIRKEYIENKGIPVYLLGKYYYNKIGSIKEKPQIPLINKSKYQMLENEIKNLNGKTSAILYGPPGNGKTSLIRYLAIKYKLPLFLFSLDSDYTNSDIIRAFSYIPPNSIVIFEDFDNYFSHRKCKLQDAKFSFDSILNGLDGLFKTYENTVFILTTNKIEEVDIALKNRPSRFKHIIHMDNPSEEIRNSLLPYDWAENSDGMNLDQVLKMKYLYENNIPLEKALFLTKNESDDHFDQLETLVGSA